MSVITPHRTHINIAPLSLKHSRLAYLLQTHFSSQRYCDGFPCSRLNDINTKAEANGSPPRDITGIRSEAVHRITFQMDYGNAVVMLKPYRKSEEVNLTMGCKLIMPSECSTLQRAIASLEGKYRRMEADV